MGKVENIAHFYDTPSLILDGEPHEVCDPDMHGHEKPKLYPSDYTYDVLLNKFTEIVKKRVELIIHECPELGNSWEAFGRIYARFDVLKSQLLDHDKECATYLAIVADSVDLAAELFVCCAEIAPWLIGEIHETMPKTLFDD